MKNLFLLIVVIGLFLLITECNKKTEKDNQENSNIINSDNKNGIDFTAMKNRIDQSSQLDIDVFFAISVLHKKYINEFAAQTASMTEDQQKEFYNSKKMEFFKSIKYSEQDYENFMKKHSNEMNDYINNHKAIADYLISIN